MQEGAPHSHPMEHAQLTAQLGWLQFSIPGPEGFASELVGRALKRLEEGETGIRHDEPQLVRV
jgi:hypothetical protein